MLKQFHNELSEIWTKIEPTRGMSTAAASNATTFKLRFLRQILQTYLCSCSEMDHKDRVNNALAPRDVSQDFSQVRIAGMKLLGFSPIKRLNKISSSSF